MSLKIDRLKYYPNNLSNTIGMSGILSYVIYVISSLDFLPKDLTLGIEVLYNLVFFMVIFFGIEKMKRYDLTWSVVTILLGIITLSRAFWHPMVLINLGLTKQGTISAISIASAGILFIISGIIGIRKSNLLSNYLNITGLDINNFGYNPNGTTKEQTKRQD